LSKMITSAPEPTVATSWIELLIDTAMQQGVDLSRELASLHISDKMLVDPIGRVSLQDEQHLLEQCVKRTQDPFFGLHMGEQIRPSAVGALGYASMSCATLRDAVVLMIQYEQFRSDIGRCEVTEDADSVTLSWNPHAGSAEYHRQRVEATLCSWVSFGRWITGKTAENPKLVCFQHAAPADLTEYQRIFRCEVRFNQPRNAVCVEKSLLDARLKDADPEVFRVVKTKLEQMVRAYQARGNLLQQVKVTIEAELNGGSASLEAVAARLDMKPWTLRRKLRAEDSDFTTLLDEIRKQRAHRYLQDRQFPISDIAAALGYSEQSAFNRAFKRWYNCTPMEYRHKTA